MAGLLQRQRTELPASSLALSPSFPLVHPESSSCHRSFFAKRKPRARQDASGTFLGGGKEGYIEAQWALLQRWVSAWGILMLPHSVTLCFPVTDALFVLVCPVIKTIHRHFALLVRSRNPVQVKYAGLYFPALGFCVRCTVF